MLQIIKATSEDSWGRFTKLLGPEYNQLLYKILSDSDKAAKSTKLGIKSYLGLKSTGITLIFNLELAAVDSSKRGKVIKSGVSHTMSDLMVSSILKNGIPSAAGPIGWGIVWLSVLDTLCYDRTEASHEKHLALGAEHLARSDALMRDKKYIAAFGARQMAAEKIGVASRSRAGHILLDAINNKIADGLVKVSDNGFFRKGDLAAENRAGMVLFAQSRFL